MAELFLGFYGRTDEEISMLWQEAILVLDANILLNVYRYGEECCTKLKWPGKKRIISAL